MPSSSISAGTVVLLCQCIVLCLEPNYLINRSLRFTSKLYSVPLFTISVLIKASLQWRCSQDLKIPSSASEAVECRNLFFLFNILVGGGRGEFLCACMYVNNSNHCVLLQCKPARYSMDHHTNTKVSNMLSKVA